MAVFGRTISTLYPDLLQRISVILLHFICYTYRLTCELGVYMRMAGGELTLLRWLHQDDQQGFANWTEK